MQLLSLICKNLSEKKGLIRMFKKITKILFLACFTLNAKNETECKNLINRSYTNIISNKNDQDFLNIEREFIAPIPNRGIIQNSADITWNLL